MAKKLFGSLVSMFERKTLKDSDILTWARVEYSDDWEFAYNHIKNYGMGPKQGVYKQMRKFIAKLFSFGWEYKSPQEKYLANSVDLADLESRQKALIYGTVNPNLRGWI